MGYVVNVDKPTNSALVHDEDCQYHKRYRGVKRPEDGGWSRVYSKREDALGYAASTGMKDARPALRCCDS